MNTLFIAVPAEGKMPTDQQMLFSDRTADHWLYFFFEHIIAYRRGKHDQKADPKEAYCRGMSFPRAMKHMIWSESFSRWRGEGVEPFGKRGLEYFHI